jgi:hypothetical protein
MDGPISTSEVAGTPPPFTPAHVRSPALGPPEKVTPVLEDSRSSSAGREEVAKPPVQNREARELEGTREQEPAHSIETHRAAADDRDKGRKPGSSTDTDHPREGRSEKRQSSPPESLPLEQTGNRKPESEDPHPLPGDSSKPEGYDDLADALAAAKQRWAEVNQEVLEANTLPGQAAEEETDGAPRTEEATARHVPPSPDPSRHEAPSATGGDIRTPRFSPSTDAGSGTRAASQDVPMSSDLHRLSVSRYQSFAMALSNPHQTRPILDVFV